MAFKKKEYPELLEKVLDKDWLKENDFYINIHASLDENKEYKKYFLRAGFIIDNVERPRMFGSILGYESMDEVKKELSMYFGDVLERWGVL